VIVAWTGHRPELFAEPASARAAVESVAHELAQHADVQFLVGGQRGVDTWAALAALANAIPFTVVLPFTVDTFARDWSDADRSLLADTMAQAAEVRLAGGYTERNRVLAESTDQLIAVWTCTAGGGTAETIELARRAGTPIREIVLEPSPAASDAQGRGI
jgi:hypothetical protein